MVYRNLIKFITRIFFIFSLGRDMTGWERTGAVSETDNGLARFGFKQMIVNVLDFGIYFVAGQWSPG